MSEYNPDREPAEPGYVAKKRCVACGEMKFLTLYYEDRKREDGRMKKCKACRTSDRKEYYKLNIDHISEVGKRYNKGARKKASNPSKIKRSHKTLANGIFNRALAAGEVTKQDKCNRCEELAVHAHHADYDKPLQVEWLCRSCHGIEHRTKEIV